MIYAGLAIKEQPREELNAFQVAVVDLEAVIGSEMRVTAFAEHLAQKEEVSTAQVKRWIYGQKPAPKSGLNRVLAMSHLVVSGRDGQYTSEFGSNLVLTDSLPDIDKCVKILEFRDYKNMVYALADATQLGVATCNVRARNKRLVRKEVRDTLVDWVNLLGKNESLPVDHQYRAVAVRKFKRLVDRIAETLVYTKEQVANMVIRDGVKLRKSTLLKDYFQPSVTKGRDKIPYDLYVSVKGIHDMIMKRVTRIKNTDYWIDLFSFRSYKHLQRALSEATELEMKDCDIKNRWVDMDVRKQLNSWRRKEGKGERADIEPSYRRINKGDFLAIVDSITESESMEKRELAALVVRRTGAEYDRVYRSYFRLSDRSLIPVDVYDTVVNLKLEFDAERNNTFGFKIGSEESRVLAAAISSETGLDASDCYLDNPAPKVSEKVVRCVRHWLEEGLTNRSLIYHQNVRYYRGDRIFNPFLRQNGIVKSVSERTMVVNWEKAGSLMMEHNAQSRYV